MILVPSLSFSHVEWNGFNNWIWTASAKNLMGISNIAFHRPLQINEILLIMTRESRYAFKSFVEMFLCVMAKLWVNGTAFLLHHSGHYFLHWTRICTDSFLLEQGVRSAHAGIPDLPFGVQVSYVWPSYTASLAILHSRLFISFFTST